MQSLEDGDLGALIVATVLVLLVLAIVLAIVLRGFLVIAGPHEALILSGRSHRGPDGREIGYRVIAPGGRVVRFPILERVDRLDVRSFPVSVRVENAYTKTNVALTLRAAANVKIHLGPLIGNAVERFLGRSVSEIGEIARQTLEGTGRGLVAALTPDELRRDSEKATRAWIEVTEPEFDRLGLCLDGLTIQEVSGGRG